MENCTDMEIKEVCKFKENKVVENTVKITGDVAEELQCKENKVEETLVPQEVTSVVDPSLFSSLEQLTSEVCPRCICRYTHRQMFFLKNPEAKLQEFISESYTLADDFWQKCALSDKRCSVCFGLLQDRFVIENVNAICGEVTGSPREFTTFQLFYLLPVQLKIFDRVFCHRAAALLGENFRTHHGGMDIKMVLKTLYDPRIAAKLGIAQLNEAQGLQITITFSHASSADVFYPKIAETVPQRRVARKRWADKWKKPKLEEVVPKEENTCASTPSVAQMDLFLSKCNAEMLMKMTNKVDHGEHFERAIKLHHTSIYVGARYNKYSRNLSQTPWFLNGERLKEYSVEEHLTKPITAAFTVDDHKFSSSGREDCDVRMLGNGRPFIVELINPRKLTLSADELKAIEDTVNSSTEDVRLTCLQIVDKSKCDLLKEGEQEKRKSYSAKCRFLSTPSEQSLNALTSLKDLGEITLNQATPIRVLHRRNLAVRQKKIHALNGRSDGGGDPMIFYIDLTTQAGTYIKEFVNSDLGRTSPSLKDFLKAEVDIIDLDVSSIDLEWP